MAPNLPYSVGTAAVLDEADGVTTGSVTVAIGVVDAVEVAGGGGVSVVGMGG